MKKAIRTQVDEKGDLYSRETAWKDDSDEPSKVRPELAAETDINNIMARAGVNPLQGRQPIWGDNNDRLDLHSAYKAVQDAKEAHAQLPTHLREKYPTWAEIVQAVEAGTIASPDDLLPKKETTSVPTVSGERDQPAPAPADGGPTGSGGTR